MNAWVIGHESSLEWYFDGASVANSYSTVWIVEGLGFESWFGHLSHRLRSSASQLLHIPPYRLTTVGRRSFPVAASVIWNLLPPAVQSSAILSVFANV